MNGIIEDSEVAGNLARVRSRVIEACERFGRNADDVRILAVSKTKPVELINAAVDAGQMDFGENYLQDALAKIGEVTRPGIVWHYIGAIQSNKTRDIANNFQWIHTVASNRVARRLNNQAPGRLNVMIQVNVSTEDSKAGVSPEGLRPLIETMIPMDNLALRGLMAIPAPEDDFEKQRIPFRRLRALLEETKRNYGEDLPDFDQLSMGMTADLEAAVAEGATWVRIGTAIFGARTTQQSDGTRS